MLVRIVKLTISPSHLDIFFKYFDEHKLKIAAFPGCKGMKLLKFILEKNIEVSALKFVTFRKLK